MQTGLLTPKGMTSQVRGVNVAIHNTHEASPTAQRPEELLDKKDSQEKILVYWLQGLNFDLPLTDK